MTNPIFNEYLLDLNAYMASQNRKILLFLDAPFHIVDEETSSRLTTCKDSIFPSKLNKFVATFGKLSPVSTKFIEMGEHAADLAKKLQVIDAMKFMATFWGSVTTETIQKKL